MGNCEEHEEPWQNKTTGTKGIDIGFACQAQPYRSSCILQQYKSNRERCLRLISDQERVALREVAATRGATAEGDEPAVRVLGAAGGDALGDDLRPRAQLQTWESADGIFEGHRGK